MQTKNKFWFLMGAGCTIIVGLSAYFTSYFYYQTHSNSVLSEPTSSVSHCKLKRFNVQGYKFVKPLLLLEADCEASDLYSLKNQFTDIINSFQQNGIITNASVFIIDMNRSEWTGANENTLFQPGSLIKVPLAISVMKKIEEKKIKLTEKVTIPADASIMSVHQTYNTPSIEAGHSYTIEDLLKYSLAYSDNAATQVLNGYVDIPVFKKVFTDLSIPEPNVADMNYGISAKDYTKFIRVLYNGGYIHRQHSEVILSLMNQSSFKDGILSTINKETTIASTKFGESRKGDLHQLHETGIIYVNNSAYVITIMTEGKDVKKLPEVIAALSKAAYQKMTSADYNTTVAKL
jgi:beta-lactamase class A